MKVKVSICIILFSFLSASVFNIIFNSIEFQNFSSIIQLIFGYHIIRYVVVFLVSGAFYYLVFIEPPLILEFIFKKRYWIALVLFSLALVFEIHGSSIRILEDFITGSMHDSILGIPRLIRSDEWAVFTPMTFSQYYSSFSYFSNILRGSLTDVFMVYGLPVKDIAIIFRPFQIGYLFFSEGRGLAFFWSGRMIALFIVSFEFGRLITQDDKRLSLVYALLVAFSPIVQWWFAINGLVEMLISGQACILIIDKYPSLTKNWKKIIYNLLFFIFVGCFLLTLYPSWMIPLAYIFLLLAIWSFIRNFQSYKKLRINPDLIIFLACFTVFALLMAHIVMNSWDTVQSIVHTVYPGARVENGGKGFHQLFYYPATIFYPIVQNGMVKNVCENAVFFDFYPVGIILGIYCIIRNKKDFMIISQMVLLAIFLTRSGFVWPTVLSKITFLYAVESSRMTIGVGFIDIILLIRALSMIEEIKLNSIIKLCIVFILSIIIMAYSVKHLSLYYNRKMIVISGTLLVLMYYSVFFYDKNHAKKMLLILTVFIAIAGGLAVNPIESGVGFLNEIPLVQEITSEVKENPQSIWVNELPMPMLNLTIMCGAPTINSTNTYPDIKKWELIDTDMNNKDVYNRYAHIEIAIQNTSATTFTLLNPDFFRVDLSTSDLKKLNIKKVCTARELDYLSNDQVKFIKLYDKDGYKIYNIEY